MINSIGGGQDNVVFMGRRSFRMELAERPGANELAIPGSASQVPTERIFDSDRERAVRAAAPPSRAANGVSNATLIALCLAAFGLGSTLTLTFYRRTEPRRAISAVSAAPVPAAPAAPTVVIQPLPALPSETPSLVLAPLVAPARRPAAKSARGTRPRHAHAIQAAAPAAKPWVDPFAE
ncbi:MAG TPA: hypothetical protein VHO06_14980 [Polyangia bacterium]|nr:hypothetical protein [Polyangia bacterium]